MDKNWTTWNTQAMQALDRGDIEQAERLPAGVRQRGPQSGQQPWLVLFFDGR